MTAASTYDTLRDAVKAMLVRGEGCCHINDPAYDRQDWQDALAALNRLREEIDYARP